jgi:hypothetical protein
MSFHPRFIAWYKKKGAGIRRPFLMIQTILFLVENIAETNL